ncbi:MAG TPA: ABC transporter substrate-binding protein [Bacillota bacterium]
MRNLKRWKLILWLVVVTFLGTAVLGGCANTGKKELTIKMYGYTNPRPYNAVADQLAEAVAADLSKIGVKVEITKLPWKEYKDAVQNKGEGDMVFFGWIGDNGDPDNFLYMLLDSKQISDKANMNEANYKSPDFDKLVEEAQVLTDPAARLDKYVKAQEILAKDAPWLFLSHSNDMVATRSDVTGFKLHPTGWIDLNAVDKPAKNGKKVFVYSRGADAVSLDPAIPDDGESFKPIIQIYDGLFKYKAGSTELIPGLAESYEVSKDGLTYTLHLRKGVKFHDGTPFNADAVVFSIDRQLPGKATENMAYASFTFGLVKSVEKVDDLTVKVTLTQPYTPFLANLAMGLSAPIVSPTAVKKYGADWGVKYAVGTGPFILTKWDHGTKTIYLKKNPNYWGGAPKLDEVIIKVTDDNTVRANEVLAGNVDMVDGIAPADVERLKADKNVTFLTGAGMNVSYCAFRTNRPPFDNAKVREAISRAVNVEAIVKMLYKGTATRSNSVMPPGFFGFAKDVKAYSYDLDLAVKLLREAGYKAQKPK